MDTISHTDLILNPDGSIYHLHLLPEDIAETILLVGDPGRVHHVSGHFDNVEVRKANREFTTHTGTYKGMRFTVLSTGIGTDNIDIVLNELDALVNVDLEHRVVKSEHKRLRMIRLGTSGSLQPDITTGDIILSEIACGFDGLYYYYRDDSSILVPDIAEQFLRHTAWNKALPLPYFVKGSEELKNLFSCPDITSGITISTPGFYAPQMRKIRISPLDNRLIPKISSFRFNDLRINNFEMECSALYALSSMLGHQAITMCVAIANRINKSFLEDYKPHVDGLIHSVLEKLVEND